MVEYKLYWIPVENNNILASKKELIGVYASKTDCKDLSRDWKQHAPFKNRSGAFFRNERGTSEYIMV